MNKIESLIEKMDAELLKLDHSIKTGEKYTVFDFTALFKEISNIAHRNKIPEYNDLIDDLYNVLNDLFSMEMALKLSDSDTGKFYAIKRNFRDIQHFCKRGITLDQYIQKLRTLTPGSLQKPQPKFSDYLKNTDKPEKMVAELKKLFPTGKAAEAARMVFALIKNELCDYPGNNREIMISIKQEWGQSWKEQAFNKELARMKLAKSDELKYKDIEAINKVKRIKL